MNKNQYNFLKYKYKNLKISNRYIHLILNGVRIFPNSIVFNDQNISFMDDEYMIAIVNYHNVNELKIRVSDSFDNDDIIGDEIISYSNGFMTAYTKF